MVPSLANTPTTNTSSRWPRFSKVAHLEHRRERAIRASRLRPNGWTVLLCSVYDTWCIRFESYSNTPTDNSCDGFDSTKIGVVDDANKKVVRPPYRTPLRGIQVKIRVYEPDSRQVREVTVTQSFLNE